MDDQKPPEKFSPLPRRLWLASALVSAACLILSSAIWYRAYTAPPAPHPDDTVVTTPDQVARYLAAHVPASKKGGERPLFIPTGVYIQSIEFKGPYNVFVSGYVWQRYADDLPKDLDRGIVMPEADAVTINQVYQMRQGNETLIGWSFRATLRQQFDYSRYPLDRQQIWLQLWHVDFERNVYLTPDLRAYTVLAPAALPGLHPDLVLENWGIEQSFFSYRANRYNTDFGIAGYAADQSQPELYFSIGIKRYVLSAVISRMVAPLVILLTLFVVVMVISADGRRLQQFGVPPGAVMFTCAAFFFAVVVAHNSLRDEVKAYGLVYLETLHVLTYFVILAVAVNSVLLVARPNHALFRDDNIWVEVAYWPVVLLTVTVATLWAFGAS
jgi:hypothetical protein